ncbi:MAG: HNH endonuclease signature motif containing protein [Pseudonocardiaceae bacterium]
MPAKGQFAPGTYFEACRSCGASFKVRPSDVRKAAARGCSPPIYCSRACRDLAYRQQGNPKWRGGRTVSRGYVRRQAPEHPHADRHGYVFEHRLVIEQHLGRLLDPAEVVHHVNHIRSDNRIENLELMATGSAHRAHHGYWETQPCGRCGTGVLRSLAHRRQWARAFCSRVCAAKAGSEANTVAATARRSS